MPLGLFSAVPTSTEWWPIALPLFAGGAAIYLLLPRPRAHPVMWGAGLGLLALVLTGVLLTRGGVSPETILFWSFSAIAILAGALLVTQHNPARAALSFALVVLSTCGLFLLLAAPFLMAATIIIYAGAIIVTFLFVIMLAQQSGLSDADDRSREPLLTTLTGFLLLGTLLFVLQRYDHRVNEAAGELDSLLERTGNVEEFDSRAAMDKQIGSPGTDDDLFRQFKLLYRGRPEWNDLENRVERLEVEWSTIDPMAADAEKKSQARLQELHALGADARQRLSWLPPAAATPLSNLSGPPPTVESEHVRRDKAGLPRMPAQNAAYLGRSLFTDFLLPVELGGFLLLIATVGAIAIAFRRS
ncbi:MAG: NADH-quinone oxidoreductase subunit J [Gemmataceae bacterium]